MAKKKAASARKTATAKTARRSSSGGDATTHPEKMLPTDLAQPSGSEDDTTNEQEPDARPTAREGLKPIGRERPHPTAAARPGKTAGEAGRMASVAAAIAADSATQERGKVKTLTVEATQMGYFDHTRRRTGDVFDVPEDAFSSTWMRTVDGSTPRRTTTSREAVKREQDRTLATKRESASARLSADRDDAGALGREANPLGD